jgi:hypothetical protein
VGPDRVGYMSAILQAISNSIKYSAVQ